MIRAANSTDAPAIAVIYNWYITNSCCTFEEEQLSDEDMRQRIALAGGDRPWIVLEEDGVLLGYAYASIWKPRAAYNRSREVTVYLHSEATGNGLGRRLYQHLIDELRKKPIHSLIASIALPNASSIALHEGLGFTKAGQFSEVGYKFGEFVDVGYWQLIL
ncbi:MAG: phosphinothricin acetyltransferase [SAR86 cluster bacterium]|uniref:Phosphinothricin acetyltransferase n=1 Tax=SAR86 cluster bacterium TaxID=2030880 RepID=A0A2A4XG16_9GAMM|nr:MAG: phosphinothricin acetyltransferase [SAR86 cluster bacterium]